MAEGLAHYYAVGDNTVTHSYAGAAKKKGKNSKKPCNKGKKVVNTK